MRRRLGARTAVGWMALFVFASSVQAAAGALEIAVDAAQRVTVSGAGESVREAVAEICRRANVPLLAYEAPDRPFAASYTRVPLAEALARLLRAEAYLVGLRAGSNIRDVKVTWLRVTGTDGGAIEPTLVGGAMPDASVSPEIAAIDLGVSPRVIETALRSSDSSARAGARRAVVIALRENRAPLERQLARDPTDLVAALAESPHGVDLAQSIEGVAADANERTLLRGITHSVRVRREAEHRQASRDSVAPSALR